MDKNKTAVEWYFDKIKSHFEHDGDLFEVSYMTYTIAKEKEKEQMRKIYEGMAQNLGHTWIKESDLPTFEEFYQRTYGKKEEDNR